MHTPKALIELYAIIPSCLYVLLTEKVCSCRGVARAEAQPAWGASWLVGLWSDYRSRYLISIYLIYTSRIIFELQSSFQNCNGIHWCECFNEIQITTDREFLENSAAWLMFPFSFSFTNQPLQANLTIPQSSCLKQPLWRNRSIPIWLSIGRLLTAKSSS